MLLYRTARSKSRPTSGRSQRADMDSNPKMNAGAMEDWWTVTPEELAIVQGAESELLQVQFLLAF